MIANLFGSPKRGRIKSMPDLSEIDDTTMENVIADFKDLLTTAIREAETLSKKKDSAFNKKKGKSVVCPNDTSKKSDAVIISSLEDVSSARKRHSVIKDGQFIIISEPLYFMYYHLHRSTKENISDVVCKFYSQEEITDAKNKVYLYDDFLQVKAKTRRNTSGKLKIEVEVNDILNALYDLDKQEVKMRFLSENMARIPPCNPGEVDPYSNLLCITDLQADSKSMKDNLGAVKAHAVDNSEKINKLLTDMQEIRSLIACCATKEISNLLGEDVAEIGAAGPTNSNRDAQSSSFSQMTVEPTRPTKPARHVRQQPGSGLACQGPRDATSSVSTAAPNAYVPESARPPSHPPPMPSPEPAEAARPPPTPPPVPSGAPVPTGAPPVSAGALSVPAGAPPVPAGVPLAPVGVPPPARVGTTSSAPAGAPLAPVGAPPTQEEGGNWAKVVSRNTRGATRLSSVGNSASKPNPSFTAAPARRDFYMHNVDGATENGVIEKFLKNNGFSKFTLRQLSANQAINKSFRLTILESEEDKLDSAPWPDRVFLKKWRFRGRKTYDREGGGGPKFRNG